MKKYLFLLLLLPTLCNAQAILQVGAGEYFSGYRASNGHVFNTQWINNIPQLVDYGLTGITDLDGAQYTGGCVGAGGIVYTLAAGASLVSTDTLGNPFTGNTKYYGWFTWDVSLRGGNVWIWGYNQTGSGANFLGLNNHENNPVVKPFQLGQPSGKTVVKLVFVRFGTPTIYGLTSDGQVWQWQNSTTPTQVSFSGTASDIASIGSGVCVIRTASDVLAFGTFASYVGLSNNVTVPTSILTTWTNAGVTFPLVKMVGNYNTLQIIDANHDRYSCGSNVCGEFGNGLEYNPYRLRPNFPWLYNLNCCELVTPIEKQEGKWADVQTSATYAFYVYGQDMGSNWYSWGRNKALCLGGGLTLSINDYANYPNNKDITAPRNIFPLNQTWVVLPIDLGAVQHPLANAGINQYISVPTATVKAIASSQQLSCTLSGYLWAQISGSAATITSPTSATTTITGLTNGIYTFRVTTTNSCALTDMDDITITVSGVVPNPPVGDTVKTNKIFRQSTMINPHTMLLTFASTNITTKTQSFGVEKRLTPTGVWIGVGGNIMPQPTDTLFPVIDYTVVKGDNFYRVRALDKIKGVLYYSYSPVFLKKN